VFRKLLILAIVGLPLSAANARVDLCVRPYSRLIFKDTVEACLRDARRGSVRAKFHLGLFYYLEDGVREDVPTAVRWFTAAAKAGDLSAQKMLGYIYRAGDGVPKNVELAAKWYGVAARRGDRDARLALAGIYVERLTAELARRLAGYARTAEEVATAPNQLAAAVRAVNGDLVGSLDRAHSRPRDVDAADRGASPPHRTEIARTEIARTEIARAEIAEVPRGVPDAGTEGERRLRLGAPAKAPAASLCRRRGARRDASASLPGMESGVGRVSDLQQP
jgi:TPR repeat protein